MNSSVSSPSSLPQLSARPLAGKVALVTGASKGIGAAIARHLAGAGAAVVVNYARDQAGADAVVSSITAAGGRAVAAQGDLSKPDVAAGLAALAKASFGRIDILVNNAGVYEFAPLGDVTTEHYHRQFNLNVLGLLLMTREAVKIFPETGGSVINIGSVVSRAALPGSAVYTATKAAVDAITRVLSVELGSRRIRVNGLNPGMVETEGTHAAGIIGSDLQREIAARTPLGRIGQPDDIGRIATFLASDASGWLTGEIIYAGGGNR